mmetsp:Transcript_1949/g.4947  ORF Transcript_1949/g.4947 Transcript_1949/m.4947 type:complete len:383 (+) Transcript_1949:2-1150(+)
MRLAVGIIGCGCIGQEHIRNVLLADDAEVRAIVDPNAAMLAKAAALVPAAHAYESVDAMDDVDAVIVCVPNHLHAHVVEQVSRRLDVHILCEKPLATTMADCERIARCVRPDKIFAVGLEYRHIPPMKKLLDELPRIGELKMLTIREHRFPFLAKVEKWNRHNNKTGGTLVEKGCHFFDFMALCCPGKSPGTVYARGGQAVNHKTTSDVADHAVVVVDFDDVICTLELCMFAEASANQLEVSAVGDAGKIEAFAPAHGVKSHDGKPNFRIATRVDRDWESAVDAPDELHTRGAVVESSIAIDPTLMEAGDHAGATYYQLVDFLQACRDNSKSSTLASVHDAALSVAIGLAAAQSITTKLPVPILLPPTFSRATFSSDDVSLA